MGREPKNETGGGGGWLGLLALFFARCLTLVPRSFLRDRSEMLQACLSLAHPFFLSLTTSKRLLRRLFIFMLVVGTRPRVEPSEMFGPLIKNSGPAPF